VDFWEVNFMGFLLTSSLQRFVNQANQYLLRNPSRHCCNYLPYRNQSQAIGWQRTRNQQNRHPHRTQYCQMQISVSILIITQPEKCHIVELIPPEQNSRPGVD